MPLKRRGGLVFLYITGLRGVNKNLAALEMERRGGVFIRVSWGSMLCLCGVMVSPAKASRLA